MDRKILFETKKSEVNSDSVVSISLSTSYFDFALEYLAFMLTSTSLVIL